MQNQTIFFVYYLEELRANLYIGQNMGIFCLKQFTIFYEEVLPKGFIIIT